MKYTEIDSWVQSVDIAGEAAKKKKKVFHDSAIREGGLTAVPLRDFFLTAFFRRVKFRLPLR